MRPALRNRGFTLVELLVSLAVAAMVLGIGVPAMAGFVTRMRASSVLADATSSLALARVEAVARNEVVTLCPSRDGSSCDESLDWSRGWILYADADGDGQPAPGEMLRRMGPVADGLSLRSTVGRQRVRFQPTGWASGTNLTMNLCSGATPRARIILNNAGRARVERDHADCPRA